MAGSHESNPIFQKASSSKKSKGSGKSGDSGIKKKRVQFAEEPSSKRQRVEDDPSVYKDGPLEAVSPAFENTKPYFNNGMFLDIEKLENLGFAHLKDHLQKYMCWLVILIGDQWFNTSLRFVLNFYFKYLQFLCPFYCSFGFESHSKGLVNFV